MIKDIHKDAQTRMQKSIESLRHNLAKVRTGRATSALVDHIKVQSYGSDVPLSQVASVAVSDARSLTISPWDKQMVAPIEKAIINSDLGLKLETVSRTFSKFVEEGMVEVKQRHVRILDTAALQRLVNSHQDCNK